MNIKMDESLEIVQMITQNVRIFSFFDFLIFHAPVTLNWILFVVRN
jgi:hypothetical protein